MVDFSKIKKLREELNALLDERPEYRELQDKIDEALRKAGKNPHNRMVVLNEMMQERKKALLSAMVEVRKEAKKLKAVAYNKNLNEERE